MNLPAALRHLPADRPADWPADRPADLPADRPVLIAGPTASGKSALALALAERDGGLIINADALQVFRGWPILTAQPDADDLARAPHALYGCLAHDAQYSVGQWLRDLGPLLTGSLRPIITGGTGLYFSALTQGLANIPATPPEIRAQGNLLSLDTLRAGLDPATLAQIDPANRARVQRAWEVAQATGRSLRDWQSDTGAPLLPLGQCTAIILRPGPAWLNARIGARFDQMLDHGALDEARAMLPHWNPAHQSARAIGAADLIAHLQGEITVAQARAQAITASRQYAKRQRTWGRARPCGWQALDPANPG